MVVPAQNWITYGAGFNTTIAMLADVKANPGYTLAMHNGAMPFSLRYSEMCIHITHVSGWRCSGLWSSLYSCFCHISTVAGASLGFTADRQATSATRKGLPTAGISTGRTSSHCTPRSRTQPRSGGC